MWAKSSGRRRRHASPSDLCVGVIPGCGGAASSGGREGAARWLEGRREHGSDVGTAWGAAPIILDNRNIKSEMARWILAAEILIVELGKDRLKIIQNYMAIDVSLDVLRLIQAQ
jgi:hypothetical protein